MTPPIDDPEAIRRILATTEALLLDFDGPVCSVFAGFPASVVANQLRETLTEHTERAMPESVRRSPDPFDVLFYAAKIGPDEARYIEAAFRAHEVEAIQSAEPTAGAHELIAAWRNRGHSLAIVSNNSVQSVETYLDLHGLRSYIEVVSARTSSDLSRLKPSPYLVTKAIQRLNARSTACTIIGDSTTDIQAGVAAGAQTIAYANRPSKRQEFDSCHADVIITNIAAIAHLAPPS